MDFAFLTIIGIFIIIILIYLAKNTIKQLFLGLSIALIFSLFFKIFIFTFCKTNFYFFITQPIGLKNLDKIPDIYLNFFTIIFSFFIIVLSTKLERNISINTNKILNLIFNILLIVFNIILTFAIIIIIFFFNLQYVFKLFKNSLIFTIFNFLFIILIGNIILLIILFYKKQDHLDIENNTD